MVAPTNGSAWPSPPANNQGYSGNSWVPQQQCIDGHALSGVVASNDRDVILRFGRGAFFRVRLTRACPALIQPGANVAGVTRGFGGAICRPSDVELKIVASDGSVTRCVGDTFTLMSTAEVKAAAEPGRP
jgi:hypothetical protein